LLGFFHESSPCVDPNRLNCRPTWESMGHYPASLSSWQPPSPPPGTLVRIHMNWTDNCSGSFQLLHEILKLLLSSSERRFAAKRSVGFTATSACNNSLYIGTQRDITQWLSTFATDKTFHAQCSDRSKDSCILFVLLWYVFLCILYFVFHILLVFYVLRLS